MAFTKGTSTSSSATSTGLTVSHNNDGNFLTVGIGIRGSQTVTMTYAGVAMTLDEERVHATDPERVAIFSLSSPAAGANNLVVSLSGSVLHFVSATSWTADSGSAAKEVSASSEYDGAGVDAPATTLPASTGGLAFDCVSSEEAASPPWTGPGGDQTQIHNTGTGSYGIGTSYELAPSSGEVMNWSPGVAETWVHVAVIYLEGGAAATYPTAPLDFQRGAFPWMVGGTVHGNRTVGLANQPRESGGPHPYGGFERFLFKRLHQVFGGTVFEQALDATTTVTGSLQNQVNKTLAASSTVTASMQRQTNKILSDTVTVTASMVRTTLKNLTATTTVSATLQALKVILQAMTATTTVTASMSRQVNKTLSASTTATASLIKTVQKTLTDTVTVTASLSALKVILKAMTATVTVTASMSRRTDKTMTATTTVTASLVKLVQKSLTATVSVLANLLAELGGVFSIVRMFGRPRPGVGRGSPEIDMLEGRPRHGTGEGAPGPGVGDGTPGGDFYKGDPQ